ncbi:hypothetical protein Ahy_A02g009565 isoform B [Arachis hypogaea]|nr:hypothetical protein Ahy_A02g009565 isoform B [Arachis hypogaea]
MRIEGHMAKYPHCSENRAGRFDRINREPVIYPTVLPPPAETDLGAVVARGRSARFSILFSSTSSACSELLATPLRRASSSSSLLELLVPISLFESSLSSSSLYPRLRALSVSLSLRRLSAVEYSPRRHLPPSPLLALECLGLLITSGMVNFLPQLAPK